MRMALGAYPGSFNPPTIAHLAIAHAAYERYNLDRVDLIVSRIALGKEDVSVPSFDDRVAVLDDVVAARPWLGLRITDDRFIADMVSGYDLVVLGADKWAQVIDSAWYGGDEPRDAALRRLPPVAVVPRRGAPPPEHPLVIGALYGDVSSTAARRGSIDLMAPEAAAFDRLTGAWTDPERYVRTRANPPG